MGFRVWVFQGFGLGSMFYDLRFRIKGVGCRLLGLGFKTWVLGFTVEG